MYIERKNRVLAYKKNTSDFGRVHQCILTPVSGSPTPFLGMSLYRGEERNLVIF